MSTKGILRSCTRTLGIAVIFGLSAIAMAETSVPYRISMDRASPSEPLRKSTIMAKVKERYPGRILSIVEDSSGGPDCHIVKVMGTDGEFRIVHVACNK